MADGEAGVDVVEVPPATSPAKTKTIDLDAARKARREARGDGGETPHVIIGGERIPLPEELPADALTAIGGLMIVGEGDEANELAKLGALAGLNEAAESFFGDAWPKIKAHGLSLDDLEVLLSGAFEVYGVNLGESGASASSS